MSKTWMSAGQTVLGNARSKIFSFAGQPFSLPAQVRKNPVGKNRVHHVFEDNRGMQT